MHLSAIGLAKIGKTLYYGTRSFLCARRKIFLGTENWHE
ncbi:hypothetical protein [Oscillospiraceae bacterium]|nr:hypothetical protein [Oscillospiraceae bacterium]